MNLDPKKFKVDESKSNRMAVAMAYPGCPLNRPCFHVVVGLGTTMGECMHLKTDGETAECTHDKEGTDDSTP